MYKSGWNDQHNNGTNLHWLNKNIGFISKVRSKFSHMKLLFWGLGAYGPQKYLNLSQNHHFRWQNLHGLAFNPFEKIARLLLFKSLISILLKSFSEHNFNWWRWLTEWSEHFHICQDSDQPICITLCPFVCPSTSEQIFIFCF